MVRAAKILGLMIFSSVSWGFYLYTMLQGNPDQVMFWFSSILMTGAVFVKEGKNE